MNVKTKELQKKSISEVIDSKGRDFGCFEPGRRASTTPKENAGV
jgi:hypothetical protein